MIAVQEAETIILQNAQAFPVVERLLSESYGAVLREDIIADRDQPPFNKALMDGIAIQRLAFKSGTTQFKVIGTQSAGQAPLALSDKNFCVEIMTGAVVPQECDCVVPYEDVALTNGVASINEKIEFKPMQNIRTQGADHKQGDFLLKDGCVLKAPHIAVAATVGKSVIRVTDRPKVAVISTGDELVDVDADVQPFQIRKSNSYALAAIFQQSGLATTDIFHIRDDKEELKTRLREILSQYDVLVLSGGVSMGKFDFVPIVLQELGVDVLFHKIAQRPGKPMWFGLSVDQKAVFALPGNPVSTEVCAYRYVLPFLKKALGVREREQECAVLSDDFDSQTDFTYFLPVTLSSSTQGQLMARPVHISGSGDFVALAQADGFIELDAKQRQFKSGGIHKLFRW